MHDHILQYFVGDGDGVVFELVDGVGALLDHLSYHFASDSLQDLGADLPLCTGQHLFLVDFLLDDAHRFLNDFDDRIVVRPLQLAHLREGIEDELVDHLQSCHLRRLIEQHPVQSLLLPQRLPLSLWLRPRQHWLMLPQHSRVVILGIGRPWRCLGLYHLRRSSLGGSFII